MSSDHENDRPTDADEQAPLPEGFPARPDVARLHELQDKLAADRRQARQQKEMIRVGFTRRTGKQIKAIGSYTMIPALMLAGPIVGYGVGWFIQNAIGGAPWVAVGFLLLGLVAGFREVILLLHRGSQEAQDEADDT